MPWPTYGRRASTPTCRRPDLILLDLNMPRMDGHQFLAEIKNDPDLAPIPIVVVTTSDEDADIVESYRLHANAFVTKPIGLEQMGKVVRAIEGFWFEVVRLPSESGGLTWPCRWIVRVLLVEDDPADAHLLRRRGRRHRRGLEIDRSTSTTLAETLERLVARLDPTWCCWT